MATQDITAQDLRDILAKVISSTIEIHRAARGTRDDLEEQPTKNWPSEEEIDDFLVSNPLFDLETREQLTDPGLLGFPANHAKATDDWIARFKDASDRWANSSSWLKGQLPWLKSFNESSILIQTVVVPGENTLEGQLIEAVALPWFEIVQLLDRNPSLAHEISDRKWEEIIAGAYERAGFDEVTLTPRSGDFGRDVIAVKRAIGTVRVIDQVKAYKPDHLVTADDARALLGVLQGDKASKGFLTTTSDFAPKLQQDILLKPFMPNQLELVNGKQLLARLKELSNEI